MNTEPESAPEVSVTRSGKSVASAMKKVVATAPKAARSAKATKASERPPRAASSTEKLVCRYCGSDDLAPSFKKRRDARCRACFKKRYGSTPRNKEAARTQNAKRAK